MKVFIFSGFFPGQTSNLKIPTIVKKTSELLVIFFSSDDFPRIFNSLMNVSRLCIFRPSSLVSVVFQNVRGYTHIPTRHVRFLCSWTLDGNS